MSSWSKVINEKLSNAIKEGELEMPEQLMGKPLNLDAYFATPHEIRMGYSVLASAGFTPFEVDLLKEVNQLKDQLKYEQDQARITEMSMRINQLEIQINPAG